MGDGKLPLQTGHRFGVLCQFLNLGSCWRASRSDTWHNCRDVRVCTVERARSGDAYIADPFYVVLGAGVQYILHVLLKSGDVGQIARDMAAQLQQALDRKTDFV